MDYTFHKPFVQMGKLKNLDRMSCSCLTLVILGVAAFRDEISFPISKTDR